MARTTFVISLKQPRTPPRRMPVSACRALTSLSFPPGAGSNTGPGSAPGQPRSVCRRAGLAHQRAKLGAPPDLTASGRGHDGTAATQEGSAVVNYDRSTALVVVDVQNDFADPKGSLYVGEGERIVPLVNREIQGALVADAVVAYTQDWHPAQTPHFQSGGG